MSRDQRKQPVVKNNPFSLFNMPKKKLASSLKLKSTVKSLSQVAVA